MQYHASLEFKEPNVTLLDGFQYITCWSSKSVLNLSVTSSSKLPSYLIEEMSVNQVDNCIA